MFYQPQLQSEDKVLKLSKIAKDVHDYKEQPQNGINHRLPKLEKGGYQLNMSFEDTRMVDLIKQSQSYNVVDEYKMFMDKYKQNFIEPRTGKSYYAVGDVPINKDMKLVSVIDDLLYKDLQPLDTGQNKYNFNIELVYKSTNNYYYNFAYLINGMGTFINTLGYAQTTTRVGNTRKQVINNDVTFETCLKETYKQCMKDIHRNDIKIIIADEEIVLLQANKTEIYSDNLQEYFEKDIEPKLNKIKQKCSEKGLDNLAISKIMLSICIAFTQFFDAHDLKIMQAIALQVYNAEDVMINIVVDFENHCVYSCKIFNSRIMPNNPLNTVFTSIDNLMSYIIYKCYDYESELVYTNIDLIIPSYRNIRTTFESESLKLKYINDGTSEKNPADIMKLLTTDLYDNLSKKPKTSIIKFEKPIILPTIRDNKNAVFNIELKLETPEIIVNLKDKLEYNTSNGYINFLDYLFKQQLLVGKSIETISKRFKKPIKSITELFEDVNTFKEVIDTVMDFFKESGDYLKIIKLNYKQNGATANTNLTVPIFLMCRKAINETTSVKYNIISFLTPSSLPSGTLQTEYNTCISSLTSNIKTLSKTQNIEFLVNKFTIKFDRKQHNCTPTIIDDIQLSSLMTLYGLINSIVVYVNKTVAEDININNFDIFLHQLQTIAPVYNIIADKLPTSQVIDLREGVEKFSLRTPHTLKGGTLHTRKKNTKTMSLRKTQLYKKTYKKKLQYKSR